VLGEGFGVKMLWKSFLTWQIRNRKTNTWKVCQSIPRRKSREDILARPNYGNVVTKGKKGRATPALSTTRVNELAQTRHKDQFSHALVTLLEKRSR